MSEDSQVTRLLAKRFSQPGERGRIVFWRDDKKQYVDDVATLVGECATDEILREVELITPEIGDENDRRYIPFTVRYRMFHEQPNQKIPRISDGAGPGRSGQLAVGFGAGI